MSRTLTVAVLGRRLPVTAALKASAHRELIFRKQGTNLFTKRPAVGCSATDLRVCLAGLRSKHGKK